LGPSAPRREGLADRFAATDPAAQRELTRRPWVARLLASKWFQLAIAGPATVVDAMAQGKQAALGVIAARVRAGAPR
jgi:hypothetical protein